MATLREALVKAKLVSKAKADRQDTLEESRLESQEQQSALAALCRTDYDAETERRERQFLARASRETVRPGGNTASKAYLKRFG
jgi:hypothetical protein